MAPSKLEIEDIWLADDGLVPNNGAHPLRLYRQCLPVAGPDPEAAILNLFRSNGWGGAWVNGIYAFQHYHADAHEVLGIAHGTARVQFGGPTGPILEICAGDAVLIPPGVGHCRIAAHELSVVGAYPPGQERPDFSRTTPAARRRAIPIIQRTKAPTIDPVVGAPK